MTLLSIPRTTTQIVKAYRAEKKLSVREFAAVLGVSYEMVYRYEDGRAEPGEDLLKSWLHGSVDWLSELALDLIVARYRKFVAVTIPESAAA